MKYNNIFSVAFSLLVYVANIGFVEARDCTANTSPMERHGFFDQCVHQGVHNDMCATQSCCEHLTREDGLALGVCIGRMTTWDVSLCDIDCNNNSYRKVRTVVRVREWLPDRVRYSREVLKQINQYSRWGTLVEICRIQKVP